MTEIVYERLYKVVVPTLPNAWTKIIIYAAFVKDSCDIKYYVKVNDGSVYDCFQLQINPKQIFDILAQIHHELAIARNPLSPDKRWNGVTIVIENDGAFHADFDYDELTLNAGVNEQWTQKYLKK